RKFITLLAGLVLSTGFVLAQDDSANDEGSQDNGEEHTQFQGMETIRLQERGDHAYLVDGEGRAVYMFTEDEENESNCTEENDCLANWPPVLVTDPLVAGQDLDDDLLGTLERDEGMVQVTYNGHPLYYYMGDRDEGDLTGQGLNDMWYLVDADGEPLEDFEPGEDTQPDAEEVQNDEDENADDNGNDDDAANGSDDGNGNDDTDDSDDSEDSGDNGDDDAGNGSDEDNGDDDSGSDV
ncbi:MAG TPA: hypothetical protein VK092_07390, partial [Deinococcales bacterium]|nr:hypothetical protein [Deinococcales bacterium]